MFRNFNDGAMAPNHNNSALEFFSKAGNIVSNPYYEDEEGYCESVKKNWKTLFVSNPEKAMKLLFWSRNPRGGAGHRRLFRELLTEAANTSISARFWLRPNLKKCIEYGRIDDLKSLYGTPLEKDVLEIFSEYLKKENSLCAKWMDRKDRKLRDFMNLTSKEYRNLVVRVSALNPPIETLISEKRWSEINYKEIPSIAGVRYLNTFLRHDEERFLKHVEENGLHAGVAYPHELMRIGTNVSSSAGALMESFFKSIPNFIKEGERILPMIDVSGSMTCQASGSITCMDVAVSLGMYCSDKVPGAFNRIYLTFSKSPEVLNWKGDSVLAAIEKVMSAEWGFNTNVERALDSLLSHAKMYGVSNNEMPSMLLILSDMQFDEASTSGDTHKELAVVDSALQRWVDIGYSKPAIVYWNLQAYEGQPSYESENVAFISGFSPAIMEAVLNCTERDASGSVQKLDPVEVMEKAISNYEVVIPD